MSSEMHRRAFLQSSSVAAVSAGWAQGGTTDTPSRPGPRAIPPRRTGNPPRRRLAVITSVYYFLSHSYHICNRFFDGYLRQGRHHFPDWTIASMHIDQPNHPGSLGAEFARENNVTLYDSVAGALTLGGEQLAVDGVLMIVEHGNYPINEKGQKLYPRYEKFQQIIEVFRRSGRVVPIFNDKHLSYDRRRALEMYETARTMNIPMMAGSSLPVTWRRPELELPLNVRLRDALVAGYSDLDTYGFHILESLQCMVERRTQGQQGVRRVRCLAGDEVWRAGDAGEWSWELLEHALGRSMSRNTGDIRRNCRHYPQLNRVGGVPNNPAAFQVEYRDGFRATAMLLGGHVTDITFAARIEGQPQPASTMLTLPPPPGAAFLEALTTRVEDFLEGRPPYPVERTVLTSGILDACLESRIRGQRWLDTPELDVRYDPPHNSGFLRGDYAAPVS